MADSRHNKAFPGMLKRIDLIDFSEIQIPDLPGFLLGAQLRVSVRICGEGVLGAVLWEYQVKEPLKILSQI